MLEWALVGKTDETESKLVQLRISAPQNPYDQLQDWTWDFALITSVQPSQGTDIDN